MSPLSRTRRRAEDFHAQLEGGARPDTDPATADLLDLVAALRSTPEPQARPEFVSDLRAQLVLAARTELVPTAAGPLRDDAARLTVTRRTDRRHGRKVRLALGTVAVMGATTSVAFASQSAIPGDALYPLKRAIENTEAGLSRGDDAKGQVYAANAADRLREVDQLTRTDRPDDRLVAETLATFTEQAGEAGDHLIADYQQTGDTSAAEDLATFTHDSVDDLRELAGTVPAESKPALLEAAQTVLALDAALANVWPEYPDPILETPAVLLSGATDAVAGAAEDLAGGLLPGAASPSPTPEQDQFDVEQPSGLDPPTDPVPIPTAVPPTSVPPTPGLPLPTDPTNPGGGGNGGGNGGNGGGKGPKAPVDLDPVTETVNDVLTGVLGGVGGVLGGVTGGLGTLLGGPTQTPPAP